MTDLMTSAGPGQVPTHLFRNRHGDGTGKRILFVAGLRGDDLSGVQALGMLQSRLTQDDGRGFGPLTGTIDLYPIAHPMGVDALGHRPEKHLTEARVGGPSIDAIVQAAHGADLVVHLTMLAPGLEPIPQIHVSEASKKKTLGAAQAGGVDAIWLRSRWEPGSLCARLEESGIPAMAFQLPSQGLERQMAREVLRGLLGICQEVGTIGGDVFATHRPPDPQLLSDGDVRMVRAEHTGLFIPAKRRELEVWEGDLLGHVFDPLTGVESAQVRAPSHGAILATRRSVLVRPGMELIRMAAYPDLP